MPGFADSFWSSDYAGGLGVLFGKLEQGIIENQQVLATARMRADAEDLYGRRLGDIVPATDRMSGGFAKDDGASLRKAYEGVRTEMDEAAKAHKKIAANISELVVVPFSRWCDAHAARVHNSQDDLQARVKAHDRQAETVRKLRSSYFNKCRQVEDLEEENKLAFQDPEKQDPNSPKPKTVPTIKLPSPDEDDPEPIDLGDLTYSPEDVKKLLTSMLTTIKLGETKVPFLGTYQNVSTGADIVEYIQKQIGASSVSYAERIGQDLVTAGFLRLVGNVGNVFANSSKLNYQWRPKVFQITGLPEKRKIERISSMASDSSVESPVVGSMGDMISGFLNNPHPNETPLEKLQREAQEADEKYKAGVRRLDLLRCNLEEAMIDHFRFMERCELDRLKAVKAVMLDFSGALSNVIPSLQSTVDKMMLYQETVQPLGDLRYLLENYRTGAFVPKVQVYDNYYNQVDQQTFGVDLEARARNDRKRVPIVVTTVLTFLDNHYPDLEGDEARRGIWIVDVPLAATHHLRNSINTGKAIPREVLERYEIPIIASVLKLYLLELPDSLVSSQVYEIIKTIYASPDSSANPETRISVLQNTLGQLRLANIATLDAITTHFTRLIELTSADEPFITSLAHVLAPCILRPKTETSLTINERHAYRLVRDLFEHKEEIFGELKRASSQSQNSTPSATNAANPRNRAASNTDESNRRANTEARNKAMLSHRPLRAISPAPLPIGVNGRHRRDRSSGPAETRFPVSPSPTVTSDPTRRQAARHSLEVPDQNDNHSSLSNEAYNHQSTASNGISASLFNPPPRKDSMPSSTQTTPPTTTSSSATANGTSSEQPSSTPANGDSTSTPVSSSSRPGTAASASIATNVEKQNSLGRSGAVAAAASRLNKAGGGGGGGGGAGGLGMIARQSLKRDSAGSLGSVKDGAKRDSALGVELVDKPMDFS